MLTATATPATPPITAAPVASTRPAQATASPPSPATQVAQAIVEPVKVVLTSPSQGGTTTPHVTTIQITPAELGRVDVRIERTNDGPAKIELIAERPETLSRLVHDQSQLQQALDQAGIPQNNRTIEFSLAPATTDGAAFSSNLSGNNASGGETASNNFQRQNNAYYNQNSNGSDDDQLTSPTQSRIVRTGIDITA
jgi:flagellar hook-length control protein FliK